jgi:hypothetical protein
LFCRRSRPANGSSITWRANGWLRSSASSQETCRTIGLHSRATPRRCSIRRNSGLMPTPSRLAAASCLERARGFILHTGISRSRHSGCHRDCAPALPCHSAHENNNPWTAPPAGYRDSIRSFRKFCVLWALFMKQRLGCAVTLPARSHGEAISSGWASLDYSMQLFPSSWKRVLSNLIASMNYGLNLSGRFHGKA